VYRKTVKESVKESVGITVNLKPEKN
jgi:hypothetical protein